jgi:hypothetical protein
MDSLEDRIAQSGRHDEFCAAIEKFENSCRTRNDQLILYDKLEELGAYPEEADEFINMIMA